MQTGFVNLGNKIVYYNLNGQMLYGKQNIDDDYYYFDEVNGAMAINMWIKGEYYGEKGKKEN